MKNDDTAPVTPEQHPLEPFLPEGARVLMLGTFPPKRNRWAMDFYYPNFQNDMWRIMGVVFFGDRDLFLAPDGRRFDREAIMEFCTVRGIALSDTAQEVVRLRDNASDQFLQITRPRDIGALLTRLPECRTVVTAGLKATETLLDGTGSAVPGVGGSVEVTIAGRVVTLWRMPSSSRAYPMALDKKAEAYRAMFAAAGVL